MANICRTRKYHVVFQEAHKPGEDFKDIQNLTVDIYANSAEEAVKKSWEATKLDTDYYDVVMVDAVRNYPIAPSSNRYSD